MSKFDLLLLLLLGSVNFSKQLSLRLLRKCVFGQVNYVAACMFVMCFMFVFYWFYYSIVCCICLFVIVLFLLSCSHCSTQGNPNRVKLNLWWPRFAKKFNTEFNPDKWRKRLTLKCQIQPKIKKHKEIHWEIQRIVPHGTLNHFSSLLEPTKVQISWSPESPGDQDGRLDKYFQRHTWHADVASLSTAQPKTHVARSLSTDCCFARDHRIVYFTEARSSVKSFWVCVTRASPTSRIVLLA